MTARIFPNDPPRRKRSRSWTVAVVGVVLVLLACVAGIIATVAGAGSDKPGTFSGPIIASPDETEAKQAEKTPAGLREGTYAVGEDVKAGTYKTTVPDGEHCYWARLKDFDGELGSINANGNLDEGGKGRIVVKKSDAGVEFRGGCEWKRSGK